MQQHADPVASSTGSDPPLAGMRVIDLADGKGEMCGRYLADLGADVIRVEPPDGAASRRQPPLHNGSSLYFATHNANKRGVVIDLTDPRGREQFSSLLDTADILIETTRPGELATLGLAPENLRIDHPRLVIVSITDFGQTGPYRDWVGTDWVHLAMGGVLSRSGLPGLPPLIPPGSLAYECAAVQATWATLLGYWNLLESGRGDHIDFSVYEATAQVLDPGFGIAGTATGGVPTSSLPRGRPDARKLYPMFACADGHVRICLLAPRQWRNMRAWLGEPAEFLDAKFDSIMNRYAAADRLYPLIAELFRRQTRTDLAEEGQRRGVPVAALLTPNEVLAAEHFSARGAFVDAEVVPGLRARLPSGFVEVDGVRAGFRHRAPAAGQHDDEVLGELRAKTPATSPAMPPPGVGRPEPRHPLRGLRVLDLGVIVVGAELGRLFADQGAEVIKVENRAFPDGSRQNRTGADMSASFAWGHRNKLSFGVDLRKAEGVSVFKRLVAQSDVVLSNFKPGTLESLGLGYDDLRSVNPRIVMADSSALGGTGPWSGRMGYGPLVRASTSVTSLWRYPDIEDSFSDGITVYPDHVSARVSAVAALAALVRRRRTGRGGVVSVSQAETILTQMSELFLQEALAPGSVAARGSVGIADAPQGVYPCAGDDEWCVITVRGDNEWAGLCAVVGHPELTKDTRFASAADRVARRDEIEDLLRGWTMVRAPRDATALLQQAGVPAGMMQRITEYQDDPHLTARGFFRVFDQPGIDEPLPTENGPARFEEIAPPELEPAPLPGQHTHEICSRVLEMDDVEIDRLVAVGALEVLGSKVTSTSSG